MLIRILLRLFFLRIVREDVKPILGQISFGAHSICIIENLLLLKVFNWQQQRRTETSKYGVLCSKNGIAYRQPRDNKRKLWSLACADKNLNWMTHISNRICELSYQRTHLKQRNTFLQQTKHNTCRHRHRHRHSATLCRLDKVKKYIGQKGRVYSKGARKNGYTTTGIWGRCSRSRSRKVR